MISLRQVQNRGSFNIINLKGNGETMTPEEYIYQMLDVDLNQVMADLMNTAIRLDRTYMGKKDNYFMKYVQSTDRTLPDILMFDLINFLSKLAVSDGQFSEVELNFMMENIPLQLSREQFIQLANTCLNEFSEDTPESLLLFMEDDNIMSKIAERTNSPFQPDSAERFYMALNVIGVHFIACDGQIDSNEYDVFLAYINGIKEIIDNFDIEQFSQEYNQSTIGNLVDDLIEINPMTSPNNTDNYNVIETEIDHGDITKEDILVEFEDLNTTGVSIYDTDLLIILDDGTNLTRWDDVNNGHDIIFVSEDLSKYDDLKQHYAGLKNLIAVFARNLKAESVSGMFDSCSSLFAIYGLDTWDTSNLKDMSHMFDNCTSLVDISDLCYLDTSNVTNMMYMFQTCSSLEDLFPLADWNTSSLEIVRNMFFNCVSLDDISGLANWDMSKVKSFEAMFTFCRSLTDISSLTNWSTSQVGNMNSFLNNCSSLVDLSPIADWDTSSLRTMMVTFLGCSSLVDASVLDNWDTSKVTNMMNIFMNCPKLEKYPKWYKK